MRSTGRCWAIAVGLLLAVGCSSQELPPGSSGNTAGSGGGGGDARPTAVVDSGTSIGANCDIAIYELSPASADDGGGSPCLFPVIVRPPDPANILVRVDGNPTGTIPENFTDGWSWLNGGTSAIVLNGSWCTQAQEGAIPQLLVFYGCSIGP